MRIWKCCPSRALGTLNSPKSSSTSTFLATIAPCAESTTPPELILESPRDSLTSAPLQSLHAHKVLSLLSFSNTHISKEINPSSSLLQMENLDALLAILCSINLLLSVLGCSTTLWRSSSGFFLNYRTWQSSLPLCAYLHTVSMPSWQSVKNPQMILTS